MGLKWGFGDGQAGPCMGRCMGGAWVGAWHGAWVGAWHYHIRDLCKVVSNQQQYHVAMIGGVRFGLGLTGRLGHACVRGGVKYWTRFGTNIFPLKGPSKT